MVARRAQRRDCVVHEGGSMFGIVEVVMGLRLRLADEAIVAGDRVQHLQQQCNYSGVYSKKNILGRKGCRCRA